MKIVRVIFGILIVMIGILYIFDVIEPQSLTAGMLAIVAGLGCVEKELSSILTSMEDKR